MKSEHRHELAENDLAKLLGRWGADLDKHINVILTVLIVAVLSVGGYIYWSSSSSASNADGWRELASATTAEDYVTVAEDFPGTSVAEWATLRAANGFLRDGIRLSLTDRPSSKERLQDASESFDSLLKNSSAAPEVREQALIGNAMTLETLSDGDTSDAVAAYEALLSEFETGRFAPIAEDRIAALKTGGVQDFYAWFHQLNPKPAARPMPQDESGSIDPSALGNLLPEVGGSGLPGFPPLEVPKSDTDDPQDGEPNPFKTQEMKDKAAEEPPAEESADKKDASADTPAPEASNSDAKTPEKPKSETPDSPAKESIPEKTPAEKTPAKESTPEEAPSASDAPEESAKKPEEAPPSESP